MAGRRRDGGRGRLLWLAVAAGAWITAAPPAWAAETLRLGVFAFRPKATVEAMYQPLVDYLNRTVPDVRISLRALGQSEMEAALEANELDLLFTNPSHFVLLRQRNRLTGAIATLVALENGVAANALGGVILVPAGSTVGGLADLRGRTIAVPGTKYLGGYQAQAYELYKEVGLNLPGDAALKDVGSHDAVVRALLAGQVDAGFVRTGIVEAMTREGTLPEGRLAVVNRQTPVAFPFAVSTRLYPEWAFAALPHVNERVIRQIARALFDVEADSPEARSAGIYGFTVPADYLPVENLARALRLPPFEEAPDFTARDVWGRYSAVIVIGLAAGAVIIVLALILAVNNRRLAQERALVAEREGRLRLANEQLNRQARELERVNAELEQFAYVASHDLRQPLRAVTSYLELIRRGLGPDLDEDMESFIGFAVGGAKRMDSLIKDLLAYSRTGRNSRPFEPVPLDKAVADAVDVLQVAIEETRGTVTVRDPLPVVAGDAGELTRLFQNLIGNAIKYHAPDRPPVVTLSCTAADGGWRITVADNGIGFDPAQSERVFAVFQRLVSGDRYEGTGIGLAICRKIVEHHGGSIRADSVPGEGSRFTITLPATLPATGAAIRAAPAEAA